MAKEAKTTKAVKTADKKTAVKTTKVSYEAKDLRAKDLKALVEDLKAVKGDLADARRSLSAGELVNPNVISTYRKSIARIQTIIVEQARITQGKEDA